MKKNSGVTLISLVVTIIFLLTLASISVKVSMDAYYYTKKQTYITQMKVIQSTVDIVSEDKNFDKRDFNNLNDLETLNNTDYIFFATLISNPENYNINTEKVWDNNIGNYYYFTPTDLDKDLNLKDQEMTVIINFNTRCIISKTPVKIDGKNYYRQYDIDIANQIFN